MMSHDKKISQEKGVQLITVLSMVLISLMFGWGKFMRITYPATRKELVERDNRQLWCVRSFLLDLLGCTLFTYKSNMKIEVIYLETMQDLSTMG